MLTKDTLVKYHGQLPPQHNLAEEILLGGILLRKEVIQIVLKELVTDSFALEAHQLIYRTILDIYFEKHHIDSIILINSLWELNLLNEIGGINKILNLLRQAQVFMCKNISSKKIEYYIQIIQDKYFRRLLIQYGYDIIKLSYNNSIPSDLILLKTEKYLSNIKKLLIQQTPANTTQRITKILLELKSSNYNDSNLGFKTGFHTLDQIISGLKKSDLIIIAGRPSMGKTSLSLNIILNLIHQTCKGICFFSLEMSKDQILYKLLSIGSKISLQKIRSRKINNTEWTKIQGTGKHLVDAKLHIDDTANLSIMNLKMKALAIQNNDGPINLIIIDYLQLLHLNDQSITNRAEELSAITRFLKIFAKELNIPIIVLSQLNRNVESRINKRPLLSDLRESGCVEFDTQIIDCNLTNDINQLKQYDSFYHKTRYNRIINVQQTTPQYKYLIHNHSSKMLGLTHNHYVLSALGWQKNDQLKYNSKILAKTIKNCIVNDKYQHIPHIILNRKYLMYDIKIPENKFFHSNEMLYVHNSIEQDADLVLFLYRDAYYNDNNNNNNMTELIIAKQRNGPTGIAQLQFNTQFASFENIDS